LSRAASSCSVISRAPLSSAVTRISLGLEADLEDVERAAPGRVVTDPVDEAHRLQAFHTLTLKEFVGPLYGDAGGVHDLAHGQHPHGHRILEIHERLPLQVVQDQPALALPFSRDSPMR
jgi:hypothetical protein